MKRQAGMTLIELVIVIVVLGIIAAVAAPRFADISTSAKTASIDGSVGAVKSAHTIAIGELKRVPTVTELTGYVDGGTAVATGVQVTIGGTNYTILTFTDSACTAATAAVGNSVSCVKGYL